jgi:hypothetical protein
MAKASIERKDSNNLKFLDPDEEKRVSRNEGETGRLIPLTTFWVLVGGGANQNPSSLRRGELKDQRRGV